MNNLPLKNSRKNKKHTMHHWHRNFGISILLIVSVLAITGLALNHNDDFTFNKKYVESDWILDFYGMSAPRNILTFSLNGNWVYKIDSTLYFNNLKMQHDGGSLVAAIKISGMNVIVLENDILLLNDDGELIDQLSDNTDLLKNIQTAGVRHNKFFVKTAEAILQTDAEFLDWHPVKDQRISWITASVTPENIVDKINRNYRGNGLSYERVLLDVHSGRIFGKFGVYIVDLASIGLLVMCLSGAWMWMRPKKRKKKLINDNNESNQLNLNRNKL